MEVNNIKGVVIGKIKGFYEVEIENEILTFKLKGSLKKKEDKLNCVIGDIVEVDKKLGIITKIFDRKNLLLRPLISNIDYLLYICSIKNPNFDYNTFQKNLLWADMQDIETIVVLNKIDLLTNEETEEFKKNFNEMFKNRKSIYISMKENINMLELKEVMKNKNIVLSGASGVGKSSLINYIFGENNSLVGEISNKTKKGKNTTVNTKVFENKEYKVIDTPGYSSINIPEFKNDMAISLCFEEFKEYIQFCKFRNCIHIDEINCAIKQAVNENKININRYNFYVSILKSRKEGLK